LHRRAVAIVRQATGVDEDAAEGLLSVSGGEVKTAIMLGRTGIEPELARERLAAHGGILRAALESIQ